MKLKIESTETGEVFNMRMESSIDKLKFQVSLLIPIPPHDQIMLIGPPYKILDSLYGPALSVEGKRIFVFNRRILSDESKEPQRIKLLPYEVSKPELGTNREFSVGYSEDSSPVLEFENYFQQQLKKSQCYEAYIQESYKSCKTSVAQHQVQLDGIGAAISNLQYFHRSINKTYSALESKLSQQQGTHSTLLDGFDNSLQSLSAIPLHPAIRAAIEDYAASSLNTSNTSGLPQPLPGGASGGSVTASETLYDCIPVEREKVYLAQCVANHKKVYENLLRVRSVYSEVMAGVQELQLPPVDFDALEHHLETINEENIAQAEIMRRFRRDYQFVYDHITHSSSPSRQSTLNRTTATTAQGLQSTATDAPSSGPNTGGGDEFNTSTNLAASPERESFAMATFGGPIDAVLGTDRGSFSSATESVMTSPVSPGDDVDRVLAELQRRKNSQEGGHYIQLMEQRVRRVRDAKSEIERSQNWLLRSIYRLMRQIALLQTDIQFKLKRDVEWMRKLTAGHNEYFLHLEQIAKLPIVYQHLLNEIVRRRNYNALFENEVIAASERIANFRLEETKHREQFMQTYGLHLPPIFFKAIPTLKDKPPYFSPTLTDPQWLPEVNYEDVDRTYLTGDLSPHQQVSFLGSALGDAETVNTEQDRAAGLLAADDSRSDGRGNTGGPSDGFGDRANRDSATMSSTPITESNLNALLNKFGRADEGIDDASNISGLTGGMQSNSISKQLPSQAHPTTRGGGGGLHVDTAEDGEGMGGSVILRAMPNDPQSDSYQLLMQKYSKLAYENSQLLFKMAELKKQLEESKGQQPATQTITAPAEKVSTSVDASPPASENVPATTVATVPASAPVPAPAPAPSTPSTSAKSVKSPTAAEGRSMKSPAGISNSVESEELQSKLSKVGVLNQLMKGYAQLKQTIDADVTTQAYLADLEAHHTLPGSEYTLYAGDETYIEHPSGAIRPIKDTMQEVQRAIHSLLFGLNYELKYPKISFMNFKAGDIALFMPSVPENRKIWMAYHASSPYRYLAEESLVSFQERSKNKGQRAHIMGRIYFIDVKSASLEENPYNLAYGTEYFVCYIEPLRRANKRISGAAGTITGTGTSSGAGSNNTSTESTGAAVAGGGNGTATPNQGSPEVDTTIVNNVNNPSVVNAAGVEGNLTKHLSGEKA